MKPPLRMVFAALGLIGLLTPPVGAAQHIPDLPENHPLVGFYMDVAEYLDLRHDIEQYTPLPQLSDDAEEFERASLELAGAIQIARESATPGEILGLDIATLLRTSIQRAMKVAQLATTDLLLEDGVPGAAGHHVAVNELFPWNSGQMLPPALVEALPLLPASLEFRLVGTTLVLVDVDADLILDILPNALPDLNPIAVWEV